MKEKKEIIRFEDLNNSIIMYTNEIINSDALAGLKTLPDNCIDCCVTSPPYYELRDYGVAGQIGLETSPEIYIEKLVEVFMEAFRVLKPSGTLWLNIGDSYNGSGKAKGCNLDNYLQRSNSHAQQTKPTNISGLKPKDMIGIPWLLAFELRKRGWYLRQDIIWHKPNPMPESVKDRCVKAHEYIFLLSKSAKYYFDCKAILQPISAGSHDNNFANTNLKYSSDKNVNQWAKGSVKRIFNSLPDGQPAAMKRSVWSIPSQAEREAHFACFPQKLVSDCIKAGCPENGIVLDPFMGSGTTAVVARKLGRKYTGFELNPEYCKISERKLRRELGMFE
jgi:DNA modification methylase